MTRTDRRTYGVRMTDALESTEPLPDPEEIEHEHPDVTGGWLRPAVFGAMDGLVSNFALMMGVVGGSNTDTKPIVLAGLAGLAAGAFSMAAGEYTSVASQSEFALAQVEIEREEILAHTAAETAELAAMYVEKGVDEDIARQMSEQIHRDPEQGSTSMTWRRPTSRPVRHSSRSRWAL
jgi:VIT1/CCC1 family predicted Fe2+/Mn2+ transporter